MTQKIGYLRPEKMTYGWSVAKDMMGNLGLSDTAVLEAFENQRDLLLSVLNGDGPEACVVAYSSSLGVYGVDGIYDTIVRYARNNKNRGDNKLAPNQLKGFARKRIQQCLIGCPGTTFDEIEKIYAHPQAFGQTAAWRGKNLPNVNTCIKEESNGTAVLAALDENDPSVCAIGPSFALQEGQHVLKKGIDNNTNSTTSFALISNPNSPLIVPTPSPNYGYSSLLFAKISGDPRLRGQYVLQSEMFHHDVFQINDRTGNSPTSGRSVNMLDVEGTREGIEELIRSVRNGSKDLDIIVNNKKFDVSLNAIEELEELGPAPVFHLD